MDYTVYRSKVIHGRNMGKKFGFPTVNLENPHILSAYKEGVYAIIGLHPIHTDISYHNEEELGETGKEFTSRGEIFDKNVYLELLKDPNVLAIGECGLDYFHMEAGSIEKQKEAFDVMKSAFNGFLQHFSPDGEDNENEQDDSSYR